MKKKIIIAIVAIVLVLSLLRGRSEPAEEKAPVTENVETESVTTENTVAEEPDTEEVISEEEESTEAEETEEDTEAARRKKTKNPREKYLPILRRLWTAMKILLMSMWLS